MNVVSVRVCVANSKLISSVNSELERCGRQQQQQQQSISASKVQRTATGKQVVYLFDAFIKPFRTPNSNKCVIQ